MVCSFWPFWVCESQHTSTGNSICLSLVQSSRSSFHRRSPEHQEQKDMKWSARPSPCCHDIDFFFWSSLSTLGTNLLHLQFLANNFVYSSHTNIKLCTYCLNRHTTVLAYEILWPINNSVLTSLLLLHLSSSLTDSLSSLNLLCHSKTDARFMQDGPKSVWSIPYVSMAFFPTLKQNFIPYRCSKMYSRPDFIFEIHQLWQSGVF